MGQCAEKRVNYTIFGSCIFNVSFLLFVDETHANMLFPANLHAFVFGTITTLARLESLYVDTSTLAEDIVRKK